MFLIILVIGLALGFAGYFMYHRSECRSNTEAVGETTMYIGWGTALVVGCVVIGLFIATLCMAGADEKIEMYQEENAKIEQQIANVVEQYQKYESDIFMEIKPESAIEMIALYPELKSDTLVKSQIEVYVANNETIKYWKGILIDRSIVHWLLYFGK